MKSKYSPEVTVVMSIVPVSYKPEREPQRRGGADVKHLLGSLNDATKDVARSSRNLRFMPEIRNPKSKGATRQFALFYTSMFNYATIFFFSTRIFC